MADTGDRTIRDRLAEALFLAEGIDRAYGWSGASPHQVRFHSETADRLLASLPTVGLRIGEAG